MISDRLERRIVEVVFWRDEKRITTWLNTILNAGDGHATSEDGVITFTNGQGFNGGFHYDSDPVTVAVMIASALTGPDTWMKAFPGLLAKIDAEWKQQRKAKR